MPEVEAVSTTKLTHVKLRAVSKAFTRHNSASVGLSAYRGRVCTTVVEGGCEAGEPEMPKGEGYGRPRLY